MSVYTKSLREDYARAITQYQELLTAASNAEELDAAEAVLKGAELIEAKFAKLEAAEQLSAKLAVAREEMAEEKNMSVDQFVGDFRAQQKDELKRYLTNGMSGLNDDEYKAMVRRTPEIYRAAGSVGTNNTGGYTVAPEFLKELQIAMIQQGGVRAAARVITTSTGADMPVPLTDDTAQTASLINENTAVSSATDMPFSSTTLHAFKWTSNELAISNELMNDSAFDIDSVVQAAIAGRFVRGQNVYFTTGTGSSQPQGVVTAAGTGITGASGQTASIIYADLVNLMHSVNAVYRANAKWMFNDSTLAIIKLLVDDNGRPLWLPSLAGFAQGAPDTILGFPYVINPDMASMGTSAKSVLFGDFNTYFIRDVQGGLTIRRLNERRALEDQTSFVAFMRTDGRKVSAATTIQKYVNAAS
jgi:HK97 family phage major capsid protein